MVIERITHKAKPGCRTELVELLKGWLEWAGATGRVLTPGWANWETVEIELDYETQEDLDKFWADFDGSRPEHVEFFKKLNSLRESGTTRVIWSTR
jgi:hypothetical protein